MKKRFQAFFLALVMVLALCPGALATEAASVSSTNINRQEYVNGRRWAVSVKSYLYENSSGGLTRVEYTNGQLIVEDYNSRFQLYSSRTIPMELPIWGGFFAGEDYNFLVFGQNNKEMNNSKEVIRIVKYSKDWQRLGSTGLYGANTAVPFDKGSLRCDEYGGYLYIRTCHEMYNGHQANVMINVRQSDMKVTDSYTIVANVYFGYVSHSFNQYILIDQEQRIVTLDHGDAGSTRAAVLFRYDAKAGQDSFGKEKYPVWGEYVDVQAFPKSEYHYNDTGCSVGGLAETSTDYVAAYNFDGVASGLGRADRDVYLSFVSKADLSVKNVKLSSGTNTSAPQLAATGLDGGYVMWTERNSKTGTLYYAAYDTEGNVGETKTAAASLSDCQPICYNGKAVWYVTNNSVPTFYTVDSSGVTAHVASVGAAVPVAHPNTVPVTIDGKKVEFQMYSLKDEKGNDTNYIKIRDLAKALKGTAAKFNVDSVNNVITFTGGADYKPNGTENSTPYSGEQTYTKNSGNINVNGTLYPIDAFQITYNGGGYTYFQLKDVAQKLNFNVAWRGGIVIETDKPYTGK